MNSFLSQDDSFREISQELTLSNGLLKDAWVEYQGEKWFPVLITDRQSGIRGFEVNFSGKWGKNNKVDRRKLILEDLLTKLADGSIPSVAAIRCKLPDESQRNGRDVLDLELSTRLKGLIDRVQANHSSTLLTQGGLSAGQTEFGSALIAEPTERVASRIEGDELTGTGYEVDPKVRAAIERYAVAKARDFYESRGYSVEEKGKPYDLLCKKSSEELHVEVKGSRYVLDAIIVTKNEISDARNADWLSDLFLVEKIVLGTVGKDGYKPSEGHCRLQRNWIPEQDALTATQFRYRLPPISNAE